MQYQRARQFLTLCALVLLTACRAATATATIAPAAPAAAPTPRARQAIPTLATTATTPARVPPTAATGAAASPAVSPAAAVPPPPAPTATLARPPSPPPDLPNWQEVARWRGETLTVTQTFSVRGPWRICWSLPGGGEAFQLMVGDVGAGTWELLTAQVGATAGRFDEASGGNYQLMFHNDVPYVAVVEDTPPGGLPPSRAILPCSIP